MSEIIRKFILSVVHNRDGSEKRSLFQEGRLQPALYLNKRKSYDQPTYDLFILYVYMYACFGITTNITKVVIIIDIHK